MQSCDRAFLCAPVWTLVGVLAAAFVGSVASIASAQTLTNLTISPTTIASGGTATGTVTLSAAAPTGGISVCLSTNTTSVALVPSSVTVAQGSTTGNFTVTGVGNGTPTTGTVIASLGSVNRTATITVTGGGSGGDGGGAYDSQVVDIPISNATVTNLRMTDIYMPKTIKIAWGSYFNNSPVFEVKRDGGSLGTTPNLYWPDAFAFTSGTKYQYTVTILSGSEDLGLPPPDASHTHTAHLRYVTGTTAASIFVTPYENIVQDNQTVDSRWDPRYSTFVYKDFKFGTRTYRGGLFVGFANDPGRVGRSFLKFNLPSWPSNKDLWLAGTVNCYFTRTLLTMGTATMSIGCQSVANTWDPTTLVWSNAPALDLAQALKTASVSYNGSDSDAAWAHWDMLPYIIGKLGTGDHLLAVGLSSADETANKWAYFAKKEFNAAYGARVLYAVGDVLELAGMTISPNPVQGGSSATGTIYLNGAAPTGGTTVYVTSSDPNKALVQACGVVIPAGAETATFVITTTSGSSGTVTFSAKAINETVTAVLTLTP